MYTFVVIWCSTVAMVLILSGTKLLMKDRQDRQCIFYGVLNIFFGIVMFFFGYMITIYPIAR